MKKRLALMAVFAVFACSTAACGSKETEKEIKPAEEESQLAEEEAEVIEEESQPAEEETEVVEEESLPAEEEAEPIEEDLTFEDLVNREFIFSSGVGGWDTSLTINKDGSFSGNYHDSDMGCTGEGYQYGTLYWCEFTGKFGDIEKINDHTYSTKIEELNYANEPGGEEIIDEMLYVYSDAYGFYGTDHMLIYTPETPVTELNEEFMSWVYMARYENPDSPTLDMYCLYNEEEQEAFASYEFEDPDPYKIEDTVNATYSSIDEELAAIQAVDDQMDADIATADMTQVGMNEHSYMNYLLWDKELNSIWSRIKDKLPEAEMDKLTVEQRAWIDMKEEEVRKAGLEVEGGSMQPLIENDKAAELTEIRVKEIIEYLR